MNEAASDRPFWARISGLYRVLFPAQPYASPGEKLRAGVTAFASMLGLIIGTRALMPELTIVVLASMGASAVLLFAAPHSPLAQPWAFVGGHLLSALIGVSSYLAIPDQATAAAVAVSMAIMVMHFLHCLHPPGGATALMAVVGGDPVHSLGYGYVLAPVGINVLIFLSLALLVNNLLAKGRRYPAASLGVKKSPPNAANQPGQVGVRHEDIQRALEEIGSFIDASPDDLDEIYSRAALHAAERTVKELRVSEIMRSDVPACSYGDDLERVWTLMQRERQHGLPVIDRKRRVVGMVTLGEFLKHAERCAGQGPLERFSRLIRRTTEDTADKPEVIGHIISTPVQTVRQDAYIIALLPYLSDGAIQQLPVVDDEDRLVGIVTQADLLAALLRRCEPVF